MFDSIHEECGLFGIYDRSGEQDVALDTYLALYALQHRGQESCGIAVCDDGVIGYHKDLGLVSEVFTKDVLAGLGQGQMAVGHVRYSTTGTRSRANAQPMVINHIKGTMAVAHNGNLTNAADLREKLELTGCIFHTTSDTEVIAHVITRERVSAPSIEVAVERAMDKLAGAYSLVIMSPQKLMAARDPNGFRPLCMGKLGESWLFSSETCALDTIGASFVREVEPGEIVIVDKDGPRSIRTHCGKVPSSFCVFEFVYFARPDSVINGCSVHEARLQAGRFLAQEHPVDADVVIGVGASTDSAYAAQYQLPGTFAPIADFDLARKAAETGERLGIRTVAGNILSSDIFYNDNDQALQKWASMGILAAEMEAAALYMNAARAGKRALCMLTISDAPFRGESLSIEDRQTGFTDMMKIALEIA